jgi:hypothetical protein
MTSGEIVAVGAIYCTGRKITPAVLPMWVMTLPNSKSECWNRATGQSVDN